VCMALGVDYAGQDCSIARSLELVGERWTLLILRDAFFGVRRFSDFLVHLDISKAVLTARLNALVSDGLMVRTGSGHLEYELTDEAIGLWPVLHALGEWGDRRTSPGRPRRRYRHLTCGTPGEDDPIGAPGGELDGDGRCMTCRVRPDPRDIETVPGPGIDSAKRTDPVSQALREAHRLLEPLAVR
jgi:DNA-binding HxlR family transcriptional regulator